MFGMQRNWRYIRLKQVLTMGGLQHYFASLYLDTENKSFGAGYRDCR